ncbi:GGDEF domain-containing protein [Paenibacillus hodogayensis]|uniref:GGDEF domain-containing protein n=1 Tax=Paenibacillus hodogayensis TaxID=279208 RepID=A0ABV5VU46_9BACL
MNEYLIPVTTSCTLVTLSYIALKLRNRVAGGVNELIAVPLFTGLAAILMMMLPIADGSAAQDLRFIPILMAGLRLGLPVALLSVIPPAVYAVWQQSPHLVFDMLHGLLLPALISSFVHRQEYRSGFEPLRLVDGVSTTAMLLLSKSIAAYFLLGASIPFFMKTNVYLFTISLICMFALIAIHNAENRGWLIQRQLELEANQDRLTGLPNIRSFMGIAENMLRKRRISILMIDIDNFKNYNDTLGHLEGDNLLREAGRLLRTAIGEKDYVARYGGEEFIVLCDSVDLHLLAFLANRLCHTVASHPFAGREIQPGQAISVSIGITVARKPDDDLYRLIEEADQALYDSKRSGKNRFTVYEQTETAAL